MSDVRDLGDDTGARSGEPIDQTAAGENFGDRMTRIKRERGLHVGGPGRSRIADKWKPQIKLTEQTFAGVMPAEAQIYVSELQSKEPEECPTHHRLLGCSHPQCNYTSQRTKYNHDAARYVFDRIMGKPTARLEQTVTVKLVEQLTTTFVAIFGEVNAIDDPLARRQAFARRCLEAGAAFGGNSP